MRLIYVCFAVVFFFVVECGAQNAMDDELEGFADEFAQKEKIYDPLSGYNRVMTRLNDNVYEYALKPVSKGYKAILHITLRESVSNFFQNIYFPIRFVNNLLQGKFFYAAEETGRFVINSTLGVLGFFDPATTYFELQEHREDFGQTLGFYGIGGGPHIVLPLLGPSNLRDAISLYPDALLSPIDYMDRSYPVLTDRWSEFLGAKAFEKINATSLDIQKYDKMKKDAVDLYPYLRDIYEQYREKQIRE